MRQVLLGHRVRIPWFPNKTTTSINVGLALKVFRINSYRAWLFIRRVWKTFATLNESQGIEIGTWKRSCSLLRKALLTQRLFTEATRSMLTRYSCSLKNCSLVGVWFWRMPHVILSLGLRAPAYTPKGGIPDVKLPDCELRFVSSRFPTTSWYVAPREATRRRKIIGTTRGSSVDRTNWCWLVSWNMELSYPALISISCKSDWIFWLHCSFLELLSYRKCWLKRAIQSQLKKARFFQSPFRRDVYIVPDFGLELVSKSAACHLISYINESEISFWYIPIIMYLCF